MTHFSCNRCHGMLLDSYIWDDSGLIVSVLRCVNCGDIIDPVVLHNRVNKEQIRSEVENRKVKYPGAIKWN